MRKTKLYNEIVGINQSLGGKLARPSSLDFACDIIKGMKNIFRIVAHLIRAIVVDHPFSDYNKRTATIISLRLFKRSKVKCRLVCFSKAIRRIAIRSESSILKIEKVLRKCCQKKR